MMFHSIAASNKEKCVDLMISSLNRVLSRRRLVRLAALDKCLSYLGSKVKADIDKTTHHHLSLSINPPTLNIDAITEIATISAVAQSLSFAGKTQTKGEDHTFLIDLQ